MAVLALPLTWFSTLYQVLLGLEKGPRFGSFVAIYGIPETRALIARGPRGTGTRGTVELKPRGQVLAVTAPLTLFGDAWNGAFVSEERRLTPPWLGVFIA